MEKRGKGERRDELSSRRKTERRKTERRKGARRTVSCPNCGNPLSPQLYCAKCKVRVIQIR